MIVYTLYIYMYIHPHTHIYMYICICISTCINFFFFPLPSSSQLFSPFFYVSLYREGSKFRGYTFGPFHLFFLWFFFCFFGSVFSWYFFFPSSDFLLTREQQFWVEVKSTRTLARIKRYLLLLSTAEVSAVFVFCFFLFLVFSLSFFPF